MGTAMNADDAVRDFWANRPKRSIRDRKIAGVASGIGHRYGLDPILIRVAFAVLTFYGGAGLLLYLLGWVLLASENDPASAFEAMTGRGRSSTSVVLTLLLCLAMLPVSGWVFGSVDGLVALLLGIGSLYLLHRNRSSYRAPGVAPGGAAAGMAAPSAAEPGWPAGAGSAPLSGADPFRATTVAFDTGPRSAGQPTERQTTPEQTPPDAAPGPSTGTEPIGRPPTSTGEPAGSSAPAADIGRANPPSWDPLGVAPFAWDLPEPSPAGPQAPAVRHRNRAVTPITIALALIAAGLCVIAHPFAGWLTAAHSFGVVLAVVGLGLVAGSLLHGGRGLILPAIPLALATTALAATSVIGVSGVGAPFDRGVGDATYVPDSTTLVRPNYSLGAGTLTLDLRRLPANSPAATTSVNVGVGNAHVLIPRDAGVTAHCSAGVGDVACLDQHTTGHAHPIDVQEPGAPGATQLTLTVQTGSGNVEVSRG